MTRPRRRRRILTLLGKVGRALAYVASLPERAIHSAAAVGGGASRLATDITLPSALRRTPFYTFVIGSFQRFIIEGLGRVKGAYHDPDGRLPKDFLVRKTVGDFVEAAGIVAVHYSPLWFFALVGGAASGSRRFLKRVVRELKKDGALPPDARIDSAENLLKALEHASMKSTLPFDLPPLSIGDLADLRRQLSREYRHLYRTTRESLPSPEALWRRMMRVRAREAIPFLRLSGALAFSGARAAGRVSGKLFRRNVVHSYATSLADVRKEGYAAFFAREALPYLRATAAAFKPGESTLTERVLTRKRKPGKR